MINKMQKFPQAVLDACSANIRQVAKEYGRTTRQIVGSINPTGDSPDKSCNIFNFVAIGKRTLGLGLTSAEVAFLAANGFIGNVNSSGLEAYIESPEADNWPDLRRLLVIAAPQHVDHFDRLIGTLGTPFSTDRQVRMDQWQQNMETAEAALEELTSQFNEQEYPTIAHIEKFMSNDDVIVITDDDLLAASKHLDAPRR
jgi:uncharacterized protein YukE